MTQIKTKTIELPTFEQLTEDEQAKVIENYYDINVDYEWYECIYDDAKSIGAKITEFDIDRGNSITLKLVDSASEVADKIIKNHGESCDTYKLAEEFLNDRDKLVDEWPKDEDGEIDDPIQFDIDLDDCEREFERALGEEYLSMLRKEYEYLTSAEAIKETLIANEYTFNRETLKIDS